MKSLILLYTLASTIVFAGEGTGEVTGVIPYTKSDGSRIFFVSVASKTNSPSCNTTNRFVFSDIDPSFDVSVSAIMAAFHSKTIVRIKGSGTCTYWSNAEDARYICVGDIPC